MKYICGGIIRFITQKTRFFIMIVLLLLLSCFFVFFAFSFYRNIQIKKENTKQSVDNLEVRIIDDYAIEDEFSMNNKLIKNNNSHNGTVTIKQLKKYLKSIDKIYEKKIMNIYTFAVIDGYYIKCDFMINNGVIVNNSQYGMESIATYEYGDGDKNFQSGRYFSDFEYRKGKKVCLVYGYFDKYKGNYNKKHIIDRNHITINNETYKIIGVHSCFESPIIPITTLSDDTEITNKISIKFKQYMANSELNNLIRNSKKYLGNGVYCNYEEVEDKESSYMYSTIIIIISLIVLISAINISSIFYFVFRSREYELNIYRICGLSMIKSYLYYLFECILITVICYFSSVCMFSLAKKTLLSSLDFIDLNYGIKENIIIFIIYFTISLLVQMIMLFFCMRKNKIKWNLEE